MIPFKGANNLKRYLSEKPTKMGKTKNLHKPWTLAEDISEYVYHYEVDVETGKKDHLEDVMLLLQPVEKVLSLLFI